ncbi:MAG TPA: protein kinase [Bryobacteraceae bacterium]|nr:protein kinase [Bryobacteraceae bacterium]
MNQQVGRYRVLGLLGKGAMGVVYLAEDPVLNRRVAIKTVELAPDDRRSQAFLRDRLVRDGRAAAGLSHPNIVSVYDVLEEGQFGYLVMEYIAGESLSAYLARTPRPPVPFITKILREMASALDYTHARGIIHRDIKPANVMLDSSSGSAKIMDFGIARITDTRTMTPAGMVMGTLEYMSPEQMKGEPVEGRTDQFALAAVAYEMLTGTTLYGEQTFSTLAYKIVNEMPPPLRTHVPSLPAGVEEVVARALRKPPAERFQSCGGFVAAFERAFAGEVPPTAMQTQAMFVPPITPPAPAPAPVAPAAPPRPPSAAYQPPPLPASTSPRPMATGPLPMAPPPPASGATLPARSNTSLWIALAGTAAAVVLGLGLYMWKPWANPILQARPPLASVPNAPSASPDRATPVTTPPSAVAPAPVPTTSPEPPKAPPPPPATKTNASEPPKTPQSAGAEPPGGDAPGAIPQEPEPNETKIPPASRAAFREGEQLVHGNRYPEAIEQFSKAIAIKPDFVRAHFARGAAYLHQNRPEDALADYTEILNHNPHNAIALSQSGICHARLHDEEAALANFNRALAIRADIPGAYNGRGLIYLHRKEYPQAVQDFTSAIKVAPDFGYAYANRAHAEELMGNRTASQADLAQAKKLGYEAH